jgi:2-methylcitrate dehydratase
MFAEYASAATWDRLAPEVIHEVKRRILDSIGVATAAFDEDAPAAARRYAGAHLDPKGATIWGAGQRAGPEIAGFANGVAVRYLDFNDTYLSLEPLHPSDVIPALFALAEAGGRPPRDLITAIAVAYEIPVTLCDAASLRRHGWDHVNYLAIGAAAGAGRLLELAPERIEHAISIATVPHASMRQTRVGELSMWKGAAAAKAGFTGPNEPLEGEMGFCRQLLAGDGWPHAPLERIDAKAPPARILDTYIKFWPVEYHAQSAVDAALQLRNDLAGQQDRIADIRIETFQASYDIIAKDPEKWDPRTRETADHSIQFIVCAALQDGDVTMNTFELDRIRRPDTLALLREHVGVESDPDLTEGYPEGIPNRITVTTTEGTTFVREVRYPRGHARNPMSDDEVAEKYRANVARRWSDERVARVGELVWNLDDADSLSPLAGELALEETDR